MSVTASRGCQWGCGLLVLLFSHPNSSITWRERWRRLVEVEVRPIRSIWVLWTLQTLTPVNVFRMRRKTDTLAYEREKNTGVGKFSRRSLLDHSLEKYCWCYFSSSKKEITGHDKAERRRQGERERGGRKGGVEVRITNTSSKSCLMFRCCDKLLMCSLLNKASAYLIANLIRALQNML